jgi:hypothetical protein
LQISTIKQDDGKPAVQEEGVQLIADNFYYPDNHKEGDVQDSPLTSQLTEFY